MVVRDGGFAGTTWYPIALAVLAVSATVAFSAGGLALTAPRLIWAAIGCLAAHTAWSFATIAWAAVRGAAWDGSNKALLYLLVFGLVASWPASARALWPVVLATGLVIAIEGVVTVERAIHSSDPASFLLGSRLSEPIGYPNGAAALFMMSAFLMVGVASRPWIPAPARGLAFGLAGVHLTLNLLAESRGSVFTLPLVVIAYLALVPGRLRSVATLAVVAVGTLPVVRPVLHVYGVDESRLHSTLRHAIDLGLVWAAVLGIAGWLFAALDDLLRPSRATVRAASLVVVAALLIAGTGSLVALTPWRHAESAWHSFKYKGEPSGTASHFGGLGSNRYDFWRVGLIEFEKHPLGGIGADNFLVPYLQLRHSSEEPIYPHNLAVRLLSQTGVIGTGLFVGFLVLTITAVARIPPGRERDLAGVMATGASVWLLHGLVDWLWEMPALGAFGFALLGGACSLTPRRERQTTIGRSAVRAALTTGVLVLTLAFAVTFALPWLALRDVTSAAAVWQRDPETAFSILRRAHRLNPLDNQADLVAGAIASRLHRYEVMQVSFQRAVVRSPDDWYANLELGIAASITGDRQLAGSSLRRAVRLNPGSTIGRSVLHTFVTGRRIDSDAVDRAFAGED